MRMRGAVVTMALLVASGGTVFAMSEPSKDIEAGSPADGGTLPQTERSSPLKPPELPSLVTVEGGRLTILVENRPLARILEEISRQSGVAVTSAEPMTDTPVSVQLKDVPLDQGLREILKDRDAFFFYGVEEKGGGEEAKTGSSLRAVWVYPKGQGRRIAPIPSEPLASSNEIDEGLTHSDPAERGRTKDVDTLQDATGEIASIVGMAKADDPNMRLQALSSLQQTDRADDTTVRSVLITALTDEDPRVRSYAIHTLAVQGEPDAMGYLWQAFRDPDPSVRIMVIQSVVPQDQGLAMLEVALSDADETVRSIASSRLEQMEEGK